MLFSCYWFLWFGGNRLTSLLLAEDGIPILCPSPLINGAVTVTFPCVVFVAHTAIYGHKYSKENMNYGIELNRFGSISPSWFGRPKKKLNFNFNFHQGVDMSAWQYEFYPNDLRTNFWGIRGTDHKTYNLGEDMLLWGVWGGAAGIGYSVTPPGHDPFFVLSHPSATTQPQKNFVQQLLEQPNHGRYAREFGFNEYPNPSFGMVQLARFVTSLSASAMLTGAFGVGVDDVTNALKIPFVLGLSGYDSPAHKSAGSSTSFAFGCTSTQQIFLRNSAGPTNEVDCSMQFRKITATANPNLNYDPIGLGNYEMLISNMASFDRLNATASGYISLTSNTIYNGHGSIFDAKNESIFYFAEGVTTENIEIRNATFVDADGLASVAGNMRNTSRITFRACNFSRCILGSNLDGGTRMRFNDIHFVDCKFDRSIMGVMAEAKHCSFKNCDFYGKHPTGGSLPIYIMSGNAVSFVQCSFDTTSRGILLAANIADSQAATGASELDIKKWIGTGSMSLTSAYSSGGNPALGSLRGYHSNYLVFANHFTNMRNCPNGGENFMIEGQGCASCNNNMGGLYNSVFSSNVHTEGDGWPYAAFFAGFHNNLIQNIISSSHGPVSLLHTAQGSFPEDDFSVADDAFRTTQQNNFFFRCQFRGNAMRGSLDFGRSAQNNKIYQCAFVNPEITNIAEYDYNPLYYQHLPVGTNLPVNEFRWLPALPGQFAMVRNSGTGNSMVDCSVVNEGSGMTAFYLRPGISWKTFEGVQVRIPLVY